MHFDPVVEVVSTCLADATAHGIIEEVTSHDDDGCLVSSMPADRLDDRYARKLIHLLTLIGSINQGDVDSIPSRPVKCLFMGERGHHL